jgi:hypothetical protein
MAGESNDVGPRPTADELAALCGRAACRGFAANSEERQRLIWIRDHIHDLFFDTDALDWLEQSGKVAENNAVRVFAVMAFVEWTLREAIATAREAERKAKAETGADRP